MSKSNRSPLQDKLHHIIFEAETPAGKFFDVFLIICIKLSVLVVMLDSVSSIQVKHGSLFNNLEWIFTFLFTFEYILRLYCSTDTKRYTRSFFGIIDLLAILPTYFSLLFPGSEYLLVIRVLRVLRVFRVLKLVKYLKEADRLMLALRASRRKIFVFLYAVLSMVIILGSLMYVIEPAENGFTSIPRSIYWAIVTLTTVGYGDISPATGLGQALAAMIMIMGYSIIAVPTGIVTVELSRVSGQVVSNKSCVGCSSEKHDQDATYCKYCGKELIFSDEE